MTDKEIIIDGIDVSKCEYFKDGMCYAECDLEGYTDWECKDTELSNCYFKQLARKTQECEELKVYAQRQENQREEYYKEYLKLSQECEKYKQSLDEIEKYCDNQICLTGDLPFRTTASDILDIISKAKVGK